MKTGWVGRFVAGIGVFLMLGAGAAESQVFVYRLKLEEQPGKQLNFDFYESGYFIAPAAESGTGTFIFTADDGDGLKFYAVAQDAARYFIVRKGSVKKAVVFTSSENGSANSVYMVVGEVGETFNFGGEIGRVRYAEKLTGYVLAADDESDPVYDDGSASTEGFAGMSTMTMTLDESRTGDASRNSKSAAEVVDELVRHLESHGFEGEGTSGDPEGSLVGTDEDGTPIFSAETVSDGGAAESEADTGGDDGVFVPGVGFGGAGEIDDF